MKLSDINPHIRYAATHYYCLNKSQDSICYDCRLFYIKEGYGSIVVNGKKQPLSVHTTLFFPPGTRYHLYPDKSCDRFVSIVFNFDLVNDFCHLSKSLGTASESNYDAARLVTYTLPEDFSSVLVKKMPSIGDLLGKCSEEFMIQNSLYREASSALLKLCLIELIRNKQRDIRDRIGPVFEFIHRNYSDSSLTNETIAAHFNYHPDYLSQMVKRATGKTLHQYLIAYRIKMAKKKLLTTDDAVSIVAWKSGFLSTAYFIKTFKEQVGVTPGAYRKDRMQYMF